MIFLFQVASHLGKSLEEVVQFSTAELSGWKYYFAFMDEYAKNNKGKSK